MSQNYGADTEAPSQPTLAWLSLASADPEALPVRRALAVPPPDLAQPEAEALRLVSRVSALSPAA